MVIEHDVLSIAGIAANSPERCYICKKSLLETLLGIASERGLAYVVEGSNTDDLGDYRPGRQAVVELGVRSPLLEANLDKSSIRAIARSMSLDCADLPAQACLATRFGFGHALTLEGLKLVERSEQYLHSLGFGLVRVRVSVADAGAADAGIVDGSEGDASDAGSTDDAGRSSVNDVADVADVAGLDRLPLAARIECDEDGMRKLHDNTLADEIISTLQAYGFTEVSIDPSGYQMGSMNN
jgi:PP-loop superfamily ATP-utilizing enzyme